MFGFQAASLVAGTAFHGNVAACLAYPVGGVGAVVRFKGCQRPIGIGDHVDAALRADQDCEIGGGFGGSFSRFENCFGVLKKCPHSELIGNGKGVFRKNWTS